MTYVEFFDRAAIKNLCACLTYQPQRVIYIGCEKSVMKHHTEAYNALFSARDKEHPIAFSYRVLSRYDLSSAVKELEKIIREYDDCVFGLTGGEELFTMALGVVFERYPDKKLQVHKFNLYQDKLYDCDKDGVTVYRDTPRLSVTENVAACGGEVVEGTVWEDKTYRWQADAEFLADFARLWDICRRYGKSWNLQLTTFAALEEVGALEETGLSTTVSRPVLDACLRRRKSMYYKDAALVRELEAAGLLRFFSDTQNRVTVCYKNAQVRRCLIKAGQVLELKILLCAAESKEEDGTPVYNDVLGSVLIDWDGKEETFDTENEVDAVLMHHAIPVFVSCKNGTFTSEELYKLESVTNRFGGPYAKKVLVTTALSSMGDAAFYLRRRARDMGIVLFEGAFDLEDEEISAAIAAFWKGAVNEE